MTLPFRTQTRGVPWRTSQPCSKQVEKRIIAHGQTRVSSHKRGVCWPCKNAFAEMPGHTKWVMSEPWEPAHVALPCRRLASGSKDSSVHRMRSPKNPKTHLKTLIMFLICAQAT